MSVFVIREVSGSFLGGKIIKLILVFFFRCEYSFLVRKNFMYFENKYIMNRIYF